MKEFTVEKLKKTEWFPKGFKISMIFKMFKKRKVSTDLIILEVTV